MSENVIADEMTGVVLETSALCQLRCPLCFLRSYSERPEPALMPVTVARSVAPYLPGLEAVELTGWGEPLMNPELFSIIEAVQERFSGKINMTTNGMLLDRASMERMIELGLDTVCISTDAAYKHSYQRCRPGGDFRRLRQVFEEFVCLREERGVSRPLLFASFLLRKDYLHELPEFVGMAAGHGLDGVVFQMLTGVFSEEGMTQITHSAYYGNRFDDSLLKRALSRAFDSAPPGFVLVGPEEIYRERQGGCGGFDINRPFVTPSGMVSVCCAMAYPCALYRRDGRLEKTESVTFGNVLDRPLEEIFREPAYQKTREAIRSGGIPAACGDCIALYMRPGGVRVK
ncbi:MAG: radical SAM protein [bacterium]